MSLGMTASELLGTWKREAEKALGLRCSGDLELDLFKVVAQREVGYYCVTLCVNTVLAVSWCPSVCLSRSCK